MLTKTQIWDRVASLAAESGCQIFDIDFPSGPYGVLRVYLCNREGKTSGVGHDQCAAVTRKLCDLPEIEEIAPGECTIEVSTPGVNRRLSRPEHFAGAIGERVKIVLRKESVDPGSKKKVLRGILRAATEVELQLEEEESGVLVPIQRERVREARVDFKF